MRDYWGEERQEDNDDDYSSIESGIVCMTAFECSPIGCPLYAKCLDHEP